MAKGSDCKSKALPSMVRIRPLHHIQCLIAVLEYIKRIKTLGGFMAKGIRLKSAGTAFDGLTVPHHITLIVVLGNIN